MENRRSRHKRIGRNQSTPPPSLWSSISFQISTRTLNRLAVLCAGRSAKYMFDRQRDLISFRSLPDPTKLTCTECYDKELWANSLGGRIINGEELLESHCKPLGNANHGVNIRHRYTSNGLLNRLPKPKFDDGSYNTAISSFMCPHVSPLLNGSAQPSPKSMNNGSLLVDDPHQVVIQAIPPTGHANTMYTHPIGSLTKVKVRVRQSTKQAQLLSSRINNCTPLKSSPATADLKAQNSVTQPEKKAKKPKSKGKVTVAFFIHNQPPGELDFTSGITVPKNILDCVEHDASKPRKTNLFSISGVQACQTANGQPGFHLNYFYPRPSRPKEWPSNHIRVRFDPRTSMVPTNIPKLSFLPWARLPPEKKLDISKVLPYTRTPQFSEVWDPAEYIVTSVDPRNSGVIWLRAKGLSRMVSLRPNDLSISSKRNYPSAFGEKEEFVANTGVQAAGAVVARANSYQPPHGMPLYPKQIAAFIRKPATLAPKPSGPKQPVYRRPARPAGKTIARKAVSSSKSQAQGGKRTKPSASTAAQLQAKVSDCAIESYEQSPAAKGKNITPVVERSGHRRPTSRTAGALKVSYDVLSRRDAELSHYFMLTDQELLRAAIGARDVKESQSPPRRKKVGAPSPAGETTLPPIPEVDEQEEGSPPILAKTASMKTVDSKIIARRHERISSPTSRLGEAFRDANKEYSDLSGTTKQDSRPPTRSADTFTYLEPQVPYQPMAISSRPKLTMKDAVSATVSKTFQDPKQARKMARINDPTIEDHELNAGSIPSAPIPQNAAPNNLVSGADSYGSSDQSQNRWNPDWIIEPNLIDL